jgi:hypothetical protein
MLNNGLVSQLEGLGWSVSLDEKVNSSSPTAFNHLKNDPSDASIVANRDIGKMKNVGFVSRVSKHIYNQVKQVLLLKVQVMGE